MRRIEGFFDVYCEIKGRSNRQGVIIRSNVHNLMLRSDIVKAVEKGRVQHLGD